jgi:hypothetical protein
MTWTTVPPIPAALLWKARRDEIFFPFLVAMPKDSHPHGVVSPIFGSSGKRVPRIFLLRRRKEIEESMTRMEERSAVDSATD